jgi:hypothetical protein
MNHYNLMPQQFHCDKRNQSFTSQAELDAHDQGLHGS